MKKVLLLIQTIIFLLTLFGILPWQLALGFLVITGFYHHYIYAVILFLLITIAQSWGDFVTAWLLLALILLVTDYWATTRLYQNNRLFT